METPIKVVSSMLSSAVSRNVGVTLLAFIAVCGLSSRLSADPIELNLATTPSSTTAVSGSTTTGVIEFTSTDSFTIDRGISKPYSLTPGPSGSMYRIIPDSTFGSTYIHTFMEPGLGLASGGLATLVGANVTDVGAAEWTFNLSPGTYSFAWAYAAQDYQPYNDGVAYYLVKGSEAPTITVLARNGINSSDVSGPSAQTMVIGSYGSTDWNTTTFTIGATDSYRLGFFAYNVGDLIYNPVMYVSSSAGSFTGTPVELAAIPEPGTYAVVAGLGALVFVGYRRRRAGFLASR